MDETEALLVGLMNEEQKAEWTEVHEPQNYPRVRSRHRHVTVNGYLINFHPERGWVQVTTTCSCGNRGCVGELCCLVWSEGGVEGGGLPLTYAGLSGVLTYFLALSNPTTRATFPDMPTVVR